MSAIPDRRPVVLALHGFTLAGAMFQELASLIDADLVAPDLPGHGGRDARGCDWPGAVGEVIELIDLHRPDLVLGYSMGGRLAVAAALESDLAFTAVLVSAGIGIDDPAERAERLAADEALADHLEEIGEEEFLAGWDANDQVGGHQRFAAIRRVNTAQGIAGALRGMGQGVQPHYGAALQTLARRSVWLAGEHDPKYVAIARQAVTAAPDASLVVVPNARHSVIADAPTAVAAAVTEAATIQRSA